MHLEVIKSYLRRAEMGLQDVSWLAWKDGTNVLARDAEMGLQEKSILVPLKRQKWPVFEERVWECHREEP